MLVKLSSGFMYPAVDHVRNKVGKYLKLTDRKEPQIKCVIFDCQNVDKIDFTAIQVILNFNFILNSIAVDLFLNLNF